MKTERDENDQRKEPTVSERVALAEAIAERLQGRVGNPDLRPNSGNISGIDKGDTRDIAAAKAGLGSGKTLEAAKSVRQNLLTAPSAVHAPLVNARLMANRSLDWLHPNAGCR